MKSLLFFVLVLFSTQVSCLAQGEANNAGKLTWYTDLGKAREISDAKHKPIFGFFTGSDWCGWCRKLQSDVFSKPAFVEWASRNVVLLELDFPRRKQLPAELTQQNQSLQQAFKITGYPTVWLFYVSEGSTVGSMNLSALGSLGYPQGAETGKEELKFLGDANAILVNEKK